MTGRPVSSERTTPPPGAGPPPPPGARDPRFPHHPEAPGCFGCDPAEPGGMRLRELGPGLMEMVVPARFRSAPGTAHGGVVAAALDEAIGVAVWSLGGAYATARLETDFVRPVPVGSRLVVVARCVGVVGRKVYATAEARLGDADGPVAARASSLYLELRPAAEDT